MTTIIASWHIERSGMKKRLRVMLLSASAIFGVAASNILSFRFAAVQILFPLTAIFYATLIVFFLRRYFCNVNDNLRIYIQAGVLSIPGFIIKCHFIRADEIKSIEPYLYAKKMTAVLIGRTKKSAILVENRLFRSQCDFEDFVEHLTRFAKSNSRKNLGGVALMTHRQEAKKSLMSGCVAVILLVVYAAVATAGFETIDSVATQYGGLTKQALQVGDLYRIFSSFFLHLSPIHLGLNVLLLAIIGPYIERFFGGIRFVNILLLSSLSGSLLSLIFSSCDLVIGASGGILGLLGAYALLCTKYKRYLPGSATTSTTALALILIAQVVTDFMDAEVDVFSHVGGFLCGFLYASCILWKCVASREEPIRAEKDIQSIIAICYVAGLGYFLLLYFGAV